MTLNCEPERGRNDGEKNMMSNRDDKNPFLTSPSIVNEAIRGWTSERRDVFKSSRETMYFKVNQVNNWRRKILSVGSLKMMEGMNGESRRK